MPFWRRWWLDDWYCDVLLLVDDRTDDHRKESLYEMQMPLSYERLTS